MRKQQTLHEDWLKRQKDKELEPSTIESCLKALAVVVIVVSTFFSYLAFDFFTLAINIFLISALLGDLYFSVRGFESVVEVMRNVGKLVEDLCDQIDLEVGK